MISLGHCVPRGRPLAMCVQIPLLTLSLLKEKSLDEKNINLIEFSFDKELYLTQVIHASVIRRSSENWSILLRQR